MLKASLVCKTKEEKDQTVKFAEMFFEHCKK